MSIVSSVCECTELQKFSDLIKQAIVVDADDNFCKLNVNYTTRGEDCDKYTSFVESCAEYVDLEESACCLFSIDECGNVALNIIGDICNVCE